MIKMGFMEEKGELIRITSKGMELATRLNNEEFPQLDIGLTPMDSTVLLSLYSMRLKNFLDEHKDCREAYLEFAKARKNQRGYRRLAILSGEMEEVDRR